MSGTDEQRSKVTVFLIGGTDVKFCVDDSRAEQLCSWYVSEIMVRYKSFEILPGGERYLFDRDRIEFVRCVPESRR